MRTRAKSEFKERLEALSVSRIVIEHVIKALGIRRFRADDLQDLVRSSADELLNAAFKERARWGCLKFHASGCVNALLQVLKADSSPKRSKLACAVESRCRE